MADMTVDWQTVFYITSALGMIVLTVLGLSIFIFVSQLIRVLKKIEVTTERGRKLIEDVHYLRKDFKVGILRFFINMFKKGDEDDG